MPLRAAMASDQRVVVEHIHATLFTGDSPNFFINSADRLGLPALRLHVQNSTPWLNWLLKIVDNQRSLAMRAKNFDPLGKTVRNTPADFRRLFFVKQGISIP